MPNDLFLLNIYLFVFNSFLAPLLLCLPGLNYNLMESPKKVTKIRLHAGDLAGRVFQLVVCFERRDGSRTETWEKSGWLWFPHKTCSKPIKVF